MQKKEFTTPKKGRIFVITGATKEEYCKALLATEEFGNIQGFVLDYIDYERMFDNLQGVKMLSDGKIIEETA